MSKYLFLLFVVCSLFAPAVIYSQKKSDLEKIQIMGKVKKIEYFVVQYDESKGWTNRRQRLSENYNTKGNRIERLVFHDNQVSSRVVTRFDAQGRNVGNDSYSAVVDKTMKTPQRTEFILDDSGNIVETRVSSRTDDKLVICHIFKYDERGNPIERNYGSGGKFVAFYDANNNETSTIAYNGDGVVTSKTFTEYNDRHQKSKVIIHTDGMFRQEAVLRYETRFKYDPKGRIIEREIKEFNVEPNVVVSHAPENGKVVYVYDDVQNTRETLKYTSDGYLKEKFVTIYDERGNESGFDCESADFKTCKRILKYEYDENGNWTKKTRFWRRFFGDALRTYSAEEREISYY